MQNIETFVYEDTEVKKTGRTAVRKVKTIPSAPAREMTLVEITPVDYTFDWKKWVDPTHLYTINPL